MTNLIQSLLDEALGSGESDADSVFGDNADRAELRNEELTGASDESTGGEEEQPQ